MSTLGNDKWFLRLWTFYGRSISLLVWCKPCEVIFSFKKTRDLSPGERSAKLCTCPGGSGFFLFVECHLPPTLLKCSWNPLFMYKCYVIWELQCFDVIDFAGHSNWGIFGDTGGYSIILVPYLNWNMMLAFLFRFLSSRVAVVLLGIWQPIRSEFESSLPSQHIEVWQQFCA